MRTNDDDLAFIEAIRQAPYDDAPRLVYADWLEERDDTRAEYIRKMYEIIGHIRAGTSYEDLDLAFRELAEGFDEEWRNVVSKPFEVIFTGGDLAEDIWTPRSIRTMKVIRRLTGLDSAEIVAFIEDAPRLLKVEILLEAALEIRSQFAHPREDPLALDELIAIREQPDLSQSNVFQKLIDEYRDTKKIMPLSQLLQASREQVVSKFIVRIATDPQTPEDVQKYLWKIFTYSNPDDPPLKDQIIEAAYDLAQNLIEPEQLCRYAIQHLRYRNRDRRFDSLFSQLALDRSKPTPIRTAALGAYASYPVGSPSKELDAFLFQILLDEQEVDLVRAKAFYELASHPCKYPEETFQNINAGEHLAKWIGYCFRDGAMPFWFDGFQNQEQG